ncbi:YigZ family protein [Shewanella ulleungensis]|uniref:YigZ family protein n=1 Tax=Shewanella ulleungensis TaxID=2282699 RepID=A0ABQ2QUN1_9GAMM|nr:YigZ family protein [Shewanella ulleungensis]MCL1151971.1 YigZ family protein [Shewanella ulleungensis]GGP98287.1 YigZ family protein [Shewanella ulleungensis]
MIESYLIPQANVLIEEEIKHSRFISLLFHCSNQQQMKLALTDIKNQYPGASHYCYAFVAGSPENTVDMGASDDGEPSGSAGKPMLACLQGANIGELGVIVVRYFGGTKLGVGGLVRAYTSGIKQGLTQMQTRIKHIRYPASIVCHYAQLTDIEYLIDQHDGIVIDKVFTDKVEIQFELAKSYHQAFNQALATQTQGQLQVKFTV